MEDFHHVPSSFCFQTIPLIYLGCSTFNFLLTVLPRSYKFILYCITWAINENFEYCWVWKKLFRESVPSIELLVFQLLLLFFFFCSNLFRSYFHWILATNFPSLLDFFFVSSITILVFTLLTVQKLSCFSILDVVVIIKYTGLLWCLTKIYLSFSHLFSVKNFIKPKL